MTMEELLALPVSFGLKTAARALGIGKNAAYGMVAAGVFPCPVQRYSGQYLVTRPDLFRTLGLPPDATRGRGETAGAEALVQALPIPGRCSCPSGNLGRALREAVLAAARVLEEDTRLGE